MNSENVHSSGEFSPSSLRHISKLKCYWLKRCRLSLLFLALFAAPLIHFVLSLALVFIPFRHLRSLHPRPRHVLLLFLQAMAMTTDQG